MSWYFAAFVNDARASKAQRFWPLRDNGTQVCPKTVTTSFAANLLTRLVDFMPILFTFAARVYLFLLAYLCPLWR